MENRSHPHPPRLHPLFSCFQVSTEKMCVNGSLLSLRWYSSGFLSIYRAGSREQGSFTSEGGKGNPSQEFTSEGGKGNPSQEFTSLENTGSKVRLWNRTQYFAQIYLKRVSNYLKIHMIRTLCVSINITIDYVVDRSTTIQRL